MCPTCRESGASQGVGVATEEMGEDQRRVSGCTFSPGQGALVPLSLCSQTCESAPASLTLQMCCASEQTCWVAAGFWAA